MQNSFRKHSNLLFAGLVLALTMAPFLLNLLGVSFGSNSRENLEGLSDAVRLNAAMHDNIVHALLEWGAVFTAMFTSVLALMNFHVNRDRVILMIAAALLCGGIMDAFHILAASGITHTARDPINFGPFTWAASRLFVALLLVFGTSVILSRRVAEGPSPRGIWLPFAFMALFSWLTIHLCTSSPELPETMFPGQWIKRPYDLAALVLFTTVVPALSFLLCRRYPGVFSHSLMLSMLPQAGAQIYTAFGSGSLFDNAFVAAHYLKLIAYLVPMFGICLHYINSLKSERRAVSGMMERQKLEFLGQVSAGAAHEINNPLTVVRGLSEILIEKSHAGTLSHDEVVRMAQKIGQHSDRIVRIVTSLKMLAGESAEREASRISVDQVIEHTFDLVRARARKLSIAIEGPAQETGFFISGSRADYIHVLMNLIQNSLNALEGRDDGVVRLTVEAGDEGFVTIAVDDNGPGVASGLESRLFTPFFTTRDVGQGAGLGLSTSLSIARKYGGDLSFTRFHPGVKISLRLPLAQPSPDLLDRGVGMPQNLVMDVQGAS